MATVGFLGVGTMGEPMVLNLLRAGIPLVVWNRTPAKTAAAAAAGAEVAAEPGEVFARCGTVLAMLADGPALDAALGRGTAAFPERVRGRLLVNMATLAPAWSAALEKDVRAAGGAFVEAPVSGSRKPAEAGQLVAMLAGEPDAVAQARPLLAPLCRQRVDCGPVPKALLLKMTTNLFQIAMITAYAEASHLAARVGIGQALLDEVLLAGQLASDLLRAKAPKMEGRDFSVQASILNVCESNRLAVEVAAGSGAPAPLAEACLRLNRTAVELGCGGEDMVAVVKAYEAMALRA